MTETYKITKRLSGLGFDRESPNAWVRRPKRYGIFNGYTYGATNWQVVQKARFYIYEERIAYNDRGYSYANPKYDYKLLHVADSFETVLEWLNHQLKIQKTQGRVLNRHERQQQQR